MKSFLVVCARAACFCFFFASFHASAFSVWAVQSGSIPSANVSGQPLLVEPGQVVLNLFYDTEGDISWGWDIEIEYQGGATTSLPYLVGALGNEPLDGSGVELENGFRWLGGNPFADVMGTRYLFSLIYDVGAEGGGLVVSSSSSYTSGISFDTQSITSGLIVSTSATQVPLPGAALLYASCLALLLAKPNRPFN